MANHTSPLLCAPLHLILRAPSSTPSHALMFPPRDTSSRQQTHMCGVCMLSRNEALLSSHLPTETFSLLFLLVVLRSRDSAKVEKQCGTRRTFNSNRDLGTDMRLVGPCPSLVVVLGGSQLPSTAKTIILPERTSSPTSFRHEIPMTCFSVLRLRSLLPIHPISSQRDLFIIPVRKGIEKDLVR